jgi:hypothetical protein
MYCTAPVNQNKAESTKLSDNAAPKQAPYTSIALRKASLKPSERFRMGQIKEIITRCSGTDYGISLSYGLLTDMVLFLICD